MTREVSDVEIAIALAGPDVQACAKKLIEMTDDGMAITIAGVDYVEARSPEASSDAEIRSLAPPRYMIDVGDPNRERPLEGVGS